MDERKWIKWIVPGVAVLLLLGGILAAVRMWGQGHVPEVLIIGIGLGVVSIGMLSMPAWGWLAERYQTLRDGNDIAARELGMKVSRGATEGARFIRDFHDKPWYLLVGEPATGKTAALRHSRLSWALGPDGRELTDKHQGLEGTKHMDWWFPANAILIDTAGSLMFGADDSARRDPQRAHEIESRWISFLKRIRRYRHYRPINGVILALSAENLLNDTADQTMEKAAHIARQFHLARQTLQIRFPVYVLVTKSDLIAGFSPFFSDTSDPRSQFQIFGWSNPEDPTKREEPFRPEMLDEHMRQVAVRLRERRLALLGNPPVVDHDSHRRIDQVDTLFAFPENLLQISDRLRLYLEAIFPAEAPTPPPFLRGIYFTSALRQGAALDPDLQRLFKRSDGRLPSVLQPQEETSFFLRDLFGDKIFREKGLSVPLNPDLPAYIRRRQRIIMGAGVATAALIALATVGGYLKLQRNIGIHRDFWQEVATDYQRHGGDPNWGRVVPVTAGAADPELAAFREWHVQSADLSQMSTQFWAFSHARLIGVDLQGRRERGHEKLFREGMLMPVVQRVGHKLAAKTDLWTAEDITALVSLTRLVTDRSRASNTSTGVGAHEAGHSSASELVAYLVRQGELDEPTRQAWERSYARFYGSSSIPEIDDRMGGDLVARAIDGYHQYQLKEARKQINEVRAYIATLAELRRSESALQALTASPHPSFPRTHDGFGAFVTEWGRQLEAMQTAAAALQASPVEKHLATSGLRPYCDQLLASARAAAEAYPELQRLAVGSPLEDTVARYQQDWNQQMAGLVTLLQRAADGVPLDVYDTNYLAGSRPSLPARTDTQAASPPVAWLYRTRLEGYGQVRQLLEQAGQVTVRHFVEIVPAATTADQTYILSEPLARTFGDGSEVSRAGASAAAAALEFARAAALSRIWENGLAEAAEGWQAPHRLTDQRSRAAVEAERAALPLASVKIQPQYDPLANQLAMSAWEAVARRYAGDSSLLFDAARVDRLRQTGDRAARAQVRAYYDFWTQAVWVASLPTVDSWQTARPQLQALDAAAVNAAVTQVTAVGQEALQVIRTAPKGLYQPEDLAAIDQIQAFLQSHNERQATAAVLAERTGAMAKLWRTLAEHEQASAARAALLSSSVDDPALTALTWLSAQESHGFASTYWLRLNTELVRQLTAEFEPSRQKILAGLREVGRRFPLARWDPTRSGKQVITAERAAQELAAARKAMGDLWPGNSEALAQTVPLLAALVHGPAATPAEAAWLGQLRGVITALAPRGQPEMNLSVELAGEQTITTLRAKADVRPVSDQFVNVQLADASGHEAGGRSAVVPINDMTLGGRISALAAPPQLLLTVGAQNPHRVPLGTSPWWALQLLQDPTYQARPLNKVIPGQNAADDGRAWIVACPVPMPDGRGTPGKLFLILRFDRPIPSLTDWPVGPPSDNEKVSR